MSLLRTLNVEGMKPRRVRRTDPTTLATVAGIVEDVLRRGEDAVREHAVRLGDLRPDQALVIPKAKLKQYVDRIPREQRQLLARTADRIRRFARMQRECLREGGLRESGMTAGHWISPVERAGCYAPGGRFPLPSSALMTTITAREAGVSEVWVASPKPAPITLAAASVGGAEGVLAVGGAQAIAALAYGAGRVPPCDVIAGPGNRFVTAAKKLVSGDVGIDLLAGPSELVVLADDDADPGLVAADLLAQAEHDDEALPILVTVHSRLIDAVNEELERQLADLPTAETARHALANGFAMLCEDLEEACAVCDRIAPEHLALHVRAPEDIALSLNHYGALFLGAGAAEVLGDYGTGPNHVLPTGGAARYAGGLSVFTFLRVRTWMQCQNRELLSILARDAADLARLEGLDAHARSAEMRL